MKRITLREVEKPRKPNDKACLIFPRRKYASGDPPLGIAYIASFLLSKGVEVRVLDMTFNHSFSAINDFFQDYKPGLVGVYVDTIMYNDAIKLIKILKKHKLWVIAGGPHATVLPESLVNYADVVVIGEGEEATYELIRNKNNLSEIKGIWYKDANKRIVKTEPRPPIASLDKMPDPFRSDFNMQKYVGIWHYLDSINPNLRGTSFIASRGCYYNCSFCQPTLRKIFGQKVRRKSPEGLLKEIIATSKKYDLGAFFLHDDTLTHDKAWLEKFCKLLIKSNSGLVWGCNARVNELNQENLELMHKANLRVIHIGVESASQRIIDKIYFKGFKVSDVKQKIDLANRIGIKILCFFMIGAPTETRKEVNQTIRFASSLKCAEATFNIATPYPTTHLYDIVKGRYVLSNDFADYDFYSGRAFYDPELSYKRLKYYQLKALALFYLHPYRWVYLFKHITSASGRHKMMTKLNRFLR